MDAHPSKLSPTPLPTEAAHFKARYNPLIGYIFLPIGLLNLGLVLWLMLLEGVFNSGIITGVVVTAIGYLTLTRPYFSLAPNRLTLYNLLGSAVKRYAFENFSDINLKGNRLWIESGPHESRQRENVKLMKWMVNPTDWKTLETITAYPAPTMS